MLLGRSDEGRPIVVVRVGDPRGTPVLIVGGIHGTECAGIAVARELERARTRADLWFVPDLNPDNALGTRRDGRGVDLNANWSSQWHGGGRPWDLYYPGPRPLSERETRLARDLIMRIRPRVTIWYHQHMNLVWARGPSSAAGRIYARGGHGLLSPPVAPSYSLELAEPSPAGHVGLHRRAARRQPLAAATRRQLSAVLRLAMATHGPAHR